jgi:hypothetical protein
MDLTIRETVCLMAAERAVKGSGCRQESSHVSNRPPLLLSVVYSIYTPQTRALPCLCIANSPYSSLRETAGMKDGPGGGEEAEAVSWSWVERVREDVKQVSGGSES